MPVLSFAHSHFWGQPPTVFAGGSGTERKTYPQWQTTVVIGCGFGVGQVVWDWLRRDR